MKISPRLRDELKKDLLQRLGDREQNILVTAAYPLDEDELDQLRKTLKLPAKTPLKVSVDPDIVGGFVIQQGSRIIDLSLRARLDSLAAHLL